MDSQRPKNGWIAPREGGYGSSKNTKRSSTTGRFANHTLPKIPAPPKGRGAASMPVTGSQRG